MHVHVYASNLQPREIGYVYLNSVQVWMSLYYKDSNSNTMKYARARSASWELSKIYGVKGVNLGSIYWNPTLEP